MDRKEELYIIALQNQRKYIHFLRLNSDLEHNDISEEEYDKELKENEDKYVVKLLPIQDPKDIDIIKDIINKIGNDNYSTTDVGELFSIDAISKNPFI